jgi:hypothetical protein
MNPRDFRAEVRHLLEPLRVTVEVRGRGFAVFVKGRERLFVARLADVTESDLI